MQEKTSPYIHAHAHIHAYVRTTHNAHTHDAHTHYNAQLTGALVPANSLTRTRIPALPAHAHAHVRTRTSVYHTFTTRETHPQHTPLPHALREPAAIGAPGMLYGAGAEPDVGGRLQSFFPVVHPAEVLRRRNA